MASELDAFFRPRSIAILGASANPNKLGFRLVTNMRATDYSGKVFPVSRTSAEILDFPTVPSLRDCPEAPDLVLLSIPAEGVPDAIDDVAAVGGRGVIVLACGFAEAGEMGAELQRQVLERAGAGGIRIIGPNCMGVSDMGQGMNATFFTELPSDPGVVGFISQSGAFGGIAFDRLPKLGVGVSKFASIGNMSDVSHAEIIRYYAADDETKAIAAFIEGIPDGAELVEAVRDASERKPVVVLKGGRTKTGSAAAISHTGSLAGEARIWDVLLREAGAVLAEDSDDLFDAAAVLALHRDRLPGGNNLAIVTISGGPAVVAADACESYEIGLPNTAAGLAELEPVVPPFASLRNPVDLTAQIDPANYEQAVAAVSAHDDVDGILAVNVGLDLPEFGEAFARAAGKGEKPIIGYVIAPGIEEIFERATIPNLPTVERAVRAFRRLCDRTQRMAQDSSEPRFRFEPVTLAGEVLTEHEAKALLGEHGFSVTREEAVSSASQARDAASRIGYPAVLKVLSRDVVHKTDAGGVILGLVDDEAVAEGYDELSRRFPGEDVLVQEMAAGGVELILGGRRDPLAGPVVMVGLGGVLAEVLEDVSFHGAPLSHSQALGAIAELRTQRMLDGFRGAPPVDRPELAELLERLGALLAANEAITEIDLNPVIATEDGLVVVDALVRAESRR